MLSETFLMRDVTVNAYTFSRKVHLILLRF